MGVLPAAGVRELRTQKMTVTDRSAAHLGHAGRGGGRAGGQRKGERGRARRASAAQAQKGRASAAHAKPIDDGSAVHPDSSLCRAQALRRAHKDALKEDKHDGRQSRRTTFVGKGGGGTADSTVSDAKPMSPDCAVGRGATLDTEPAGVAPLNFDPTVTIGCQAPTRATSVVPSALSPELLPTAPP